MNQLHEEVRRKRPTAAGQRGGYWSDRAEIFVSSSDDETDDGENASFLLHVLLPRLMTEKERSDETACI